MSDVVSGKDPIVAWRGWGLMHPHYLVSGNLVYEPRKRHESRCIKDHMCPDEGCTCGIYAFPSLEELRRQNYHNDVRYRVFGETYLWGKVVEHERGFRAQYAYPKRLMFPEKRKMLSAMEIDVVALAPYVAYLYGVPHEIIKPDHELRQDLPKPLKTPSPFRVPGTVVAPTGRKRFHYVANAAMAGRLGILPPQAKLMFQLIFMRMKTVDPVPEQIFINDLYAAHKTGVLKTVQDPWRIWSYYKPRLIKDGFVSVVKR